MKIARPISTPATNNRETIINEYYIVENDYNFVANNAVDETSINTLAVFFSINRYNYRLYRDSLITNILPNWNTLSDDDKKNLIFNRVYPSNFTESDIINIVGQEGLDYMMRTMSDSELITQDVSIVNQNLITYTATTTTDLTQVYNDIDYLSGQTSNKLNINLFNTYSGSTLTNINSRLLTTTFNTFTGTTAPNRYYQKTGGTITGNVAVTGTISEGGILLSNKYQSIGSGNTIEFFQKEKLTTQTNATTTLTNFDTTTVNLSGGNYKITYSIIFGASVTNQNQLIEFRRAGTNIFPEQYIGRLNNTGERRPVNMFKFINLPAGNQTFSVAFATNGGTMTMYYSLILIEKISS